MYTGTELLWVRDSTVIQSTALIGFSSTSSIAIPGHVGKESTYIQRYRTPVVPEVNGIQDTVLSPQCDKEPK